MSAINGFVSGFVLLLVVAFLWALLANWLQLHPGVTFLVGMPLGAISFLVGLEFGEG